MTLLNLLEKHFKMIRYYGLYAKNHKHKSVLFLAVPIEKRRFLASLNTWRTSLLLSFGFDPLLCKCGHHMTVLEICHKGTPLIEMFRKIFNSSWCFFYYSHFQPPTNQLTKLIKAAYSFRAHTLLFLCFPLIFFYYITLFIFT